MNRILTAAEMFLCDRTEIEAATPSRVLMYRAARACADAVRQMLESKPTAGKVAILCGSGNNGGDGMLCARLLREYGFDTFIVCAFSDGDSLSAECAYRYEEARAAGVSVLTADAFLRDTDVIEIALIVDALFGIGLTREITGVYADLIDAANAYASKHAVPTVAVDIASGVFADTGKVSAHTFRAAHTLAINNAKRGHLLYPGAQYTGALTVLDIGIPITPLDGAADGIPVYTLTDDDVRAMLPARQPDSNKGTNGRILIVAGAKNMCGAAYLSALGAYRTGAGLVEIFTCEDNRIPLQTLIPEAILTTCDPADTPTACEKLQASLSRAAAVVIGPGLGTSDHAAALLDTVLTHTRVPTVLDADALNIIASLHQPLVDASEGGGTRSVTEGVIRFNSAATSGTTTHTSSAVPFIMTPHPGELSRLTGIALPALLDDHITCAVHYAKTTGTIVNAKNTRSVITDGKTAFLNPTGTSALAKGGSGDVLTGITAALCAQGCEPLYAAALAAYLHGRAAEHVTARMGARAPLAHEIADALGEVFCAIEAIV